MIEEDRYCINVLEQISAVRKALQLVGHLTSGPPPGALRGRRVKSGGDQADTKLDGASAAIARLVRS
jgi:hypothetical protein